MTLLATGCLLPVNSWADAGTLVAHTAMASSGETTRRQIRVMGNSWGTSGGGSMRAMRRPAVAQGLGAVMPFTGTWAIGSSICRPFCCCTKSNTDSTVTTE
ncbi:hypothetical protein D3C71_1516320 [compost metagenome]